MRGKGTGIVQSMNVRWSGSGLGMARTAKGHKIIFSVSAAIVNRDDMVYFINGNITSGFETMFTKGMLGNIQFPNLAPARTVMLGMVWTVAFVIFTVGDGLMFGTITVTSDKFTASGVSAEALW